MSEQRFLRTYRILRGEDFDRVFARRCSAADGVLVVHVERNELGHPRLGLVVSRKAGNAVRRNRWRRVLREAFRLHRRELPKNVDIVVIPRPVAEAALAAVARSLVALARRAERKLERATNGHGEASGSRS